ncbi:MAG TPA: DUF4097 family beta strand repeat-containing protein, partial [Candidatus Acidoferrales bacterium]
ACLIAAGILILTAPAWASSQLTRTLKLDPNGRFALDADAGSVTVMGSDQPGAIVVVTSNRDDLRDRIDFNFEENPGMVRLTAHRRSWHLFNFFFERLSYKIRVPKTTTLEIKTGGGGITIYSMSRDADLKTSGGFIEVSNLQGTLHAHTSGGHIKVEQIQGDTALETSGGGIEADSIDGRLVANTSGGPIDIDQVTGRVDAHTSGGSIGATFRKGNAHGGLIETSGGAIHLRIDPSVNLEIDASTSGGSIHSSIPLRAVGTASRSALHGTLGSGGELLRVHTSGGSVLIEPL